MVTEGSSKTCYQLIADSWFNTGWRAAPGETESLAVLERHLKTTIPPAPGKVPASMTVAPDPFEVGRFGAFATRILLKIKHTVPQKYLIRVNKFPFVDARVWSGGHLLAVVLVVITD